MATKIKPTKIQKSSTKAPVTMADLLAKYDEKVKGFSRAEKIDAKVVEINKKSVIFNVGGKSEAVLMDAYFQEARDFVKTLKVGDKVQVTVIDPETSDGFIMVSLRHAASGKLWENLEALRESGEEISVTVKSVNPSGVMVEYDSVSSFIPASQIGRKHAGNLDALIGHSIRVKVTEVDKNRRRVSFSEKEISEAGEIKVAKDALNKIKAGEIYEGTATSIMDFGIFVAIPVGKSKVEGLVHVSELSWQKVDKPSSIYKEGDKVSVKVLGIREGKLALSIKHAKVDPWEEAGNKYKVEDKVKGKVVRHSDFGVFIEIEPGIEGLIHMTKIPPATKLNAGDMVNCYIEEIDIKNKKISLGIMLTAKPVGYK